MFAKKAVFFMLIFGLLLSGCTANEEQKPTQVAGDAVFRILVGDMPGACRYYTKTIKEVCDSEAEKVDAISGKVKRNIINSLTDVLADFDTTVVFDNGNEAKFKVQMAKIGGKWVIENGAWNDIRKAIEDGYAGKNKIVTE